MQKCSTLLAVEDTLAIGITKSISDAVGDDIRRDVIVNELDTNNGTSTRIWDYINRNLGRNLSSEYYITKPTKRGRWEMKPIFDKRSKVLYTIMREERFSQLLTEVLDRDSAHYVQALAHELNVEIAHPNEQLSLFEDTEYFDEDQVRKIVLKINHDLGIPDGIIENHVLVLFSSSNHMMKSIRACVLKGDLTIVADRDWSKFIDVSHSDIVEQNEGIQVVIPEDTLKFKEKATKRIRDKNKIRMNNNSTEERKEEGK